MAEAAAGHSPCLPGHSSYRCTATAPLASPPQAPGRPLQLCNHGHILLEETKRTAGEGGGEGNKKEEEAQFVVLSSVIAQQTCVLLALIKKGSTCGLMILEGYMTLHLHQQAAQTKLSWR